MFRLAFAGMGVASGLVALHTQGVGSGLNTIVVVNQNSTNSCELGTYYCERRGVPPENVLRINWQGGNTSWTSNEFQAALGTTLSAMLVARGLTGQADYVVLSMDIPYSVSDGTTVDSTTAVLFYGFKSDQSLAVVNTNSYAASEAIFSRARPASASGMSFLATMLTGNSLDQAKALVDHGAAADGALPTAPVVLAKSSDYYRNVRFQQFDNAIFDTRLRGNYAVIRTNSDSPLGQTNLLGYQTGLATFGVSPRMFVPGAMADSLSSYGGLLFQPSGQTPLLAFIAAGASGSYGTVTEPSATPTKFPAAENYFYQARGFSLAECYYQSLNIPALGLIVGEPLSAPFATPGSGSWTSPSSNSVLSGVTNLAFTFSARNGDHPLQQVDLFVDGKYVQTLTNLAPQPGNALNLTLNGYPITYSVPANASVATVASGLASLINAADVTNATSVGATVFGDRTQLRALPTDGVVNTFYFLDTNGFGSTSRYYRARYLPPSPARLSSSGLGPGGAFRFQVGASAATAVIIEASSDFTSWVPVFTNRTGGPFQFVDPFAANHRSRFYRATGIKPDLRPWLDLTACEGGGVNLSVQSPRGIPYSVLASADLRNWASIYTNLTGGAITFTDPQSSVLPYRFYRTFLLDPIPAGPALTSRPGPVPSSVLVGASGLGPSFVLEVSTNGTDWSSLVTNLAPGKVQVTTSTSAGAAQVASTFLKASRDTFLDSQAAGYRGFTLNGTTRGTVQVGDWVALTVTKTNGACITVAVTNQSQQMAPTNFVRQLFARIDAERSLLAADGLGGEDLMPFWFGAAKFALRARSPGCQAGLLQVQLIGSANIMITPPDRLTLNENLSDLQPRDHLYVAAGASNLKVTFPLDTSAFADGFHQLTAVAYEGNHVRTQTRISLPVVIHNSQLTATLDWPDDLPNPVPVTGTYRLQVSPSTNVGVVRLFTTGGVFDSITNQAPAMFSIKAASLGVGLHPFYAIVETPGGLRYRTETSWLRFARP